MKKISSTLLFFAPMVCVFLCIGCLSTDSSRQKEEVSRERIVSSGKGSGEAALVRETVVEEVPLSDTKSRFSDVPVPAKFQMDRSKSFIYEAGQVKAGFLIYEGNASLEEIISFYKTEMPAFQWKLMSTFESTDVALYFEKPGWSCRIQAQSAKFQKTKLVISLGPKSKE